MHSVAAALYKGHNKTVHRHKSVLALHRRRKKSQIQTSVGSKSRGIDFRYGKNGKAVLNGASLELKRGEVGILLGKNGSGKTTLFKNILGIEKPKKGSIHFEGENLLKMNRRERARRIAYVPQHIHFGDLSVMDSVLMGRISYFGTKAGREDYAAVEKIRDEYRKRRDVLCAGLNRVGWPVEPPKASMFVWARIPEKFRHLGSMEFSKMLLEKANVAVQPGIGFGQMGDEYVRFALIENIKRTRQAIQGIKKMMQGKV